MTLSRREFLSYSLSGSSLVFCLPMTAKAGEKNIQANSKAWSVYVQIDIDNKITIASPVQDMGQHMKTTGVMMIAEEMDADWSLISTIPSQLHIQGGGNKVKYKYASMNTGGSHAVRNNWDHLRRAGASIRTLLKMAASRYWNTPIGSISTKESFAYNKITNEKISFGQLAKLAASIELNERNVEFKSKKDYHIFTKDIVTVDIEQMVRGEPLFSSDIKMDDMLYASVERSPSYHSKIVSYSDKEALKVKGVIRTIKLSESLSKRGRRNNSEGIVVIAESYWAALKGRKQLKVEWQSNKYSNESSDGILKDLKTLCAEDDKEIEPLVDEGNVTTVFSNAQSSSEKLYQRTYSTQHLAHLCMETLNAIVKVSNSKNEKTAEIIVGHQDPLSVAYVVAQELGIDIHKVNVNSTRMGGGFGRRASNDWVVETTKIAKHFNQPVKLIYTREDDIRQDEFGQAVFASINATVNKSGQITAWDQKQAQIGGLVSPYCFPHGLIDNFRLKSFRRKSGTPIGPWRGPGHIQQCFFTESLIDEIAIDNKIDPVDYRINMLKDYGTLPYKGYGATEKDAIRMLKCYEKVAKMASWSKTRPQGVGLGIAGHFTFGSYTAFVIEYDSRIKSQNKITNVWGVIDCGLPLNPNHIRNQMEGGFIDGLNAALFNHVKIKDGQASNDNFNSLHFMRLSQAPQNFQVAIMENDHPPTGVGEPPTSPAAAALNNAMAAATGKRQYDMPLKLL